MFWNKNAPHVLELHGGQRGYRPPKSGKLRVTACCARWDETFPAWRPLGFVMLLTLLMLFMMLAEFRALLPGPDHRNPAGRAKHGGFNRISTLPDLTIRHSTNIFRRSA